MKQMERFHVSKARDILIIPGGTLNGLAGWTVENKWTKPPCRTALLL